MCECGCLGFLSNLFLFDVHCGSSCVVWHVVFGSRVCVYISIAQLLIILCACHGVGHFSKMMFCYILFPALAISHKGCLFAFCFSVRYVWTFLVLCLLWVVTCVRGVGSQFFFIV